MSKIKILLIGVILSLFISNVDAKEIHVYMVYSETCGYCQNANTFFDEYEKENKNIKLYKYNVYDDKNSDVIQKIEDKMNKNLSSIPLIVIGEKYVTGFNSTIQKQIEQNIEYYENNDYYDPIGEALNLKSKDALDKKEVEADTNNAYISQPIEDELQEIENIEVKESFIKKYAYELLIGTLLVVLVVLEIIKRKPSK